MTPTMRKYLDIKASHAPHSRPPSRPDSAQSCHSQGAEVQSTKRTLQSKPQDIAKAPVDLAHFRSASAPQAVPERHRQTLRSGDTTQPSSDRAQSSRHPNHSRPASSNDRRRADMPPPEHIPSRPAQRPVSSLSTRSHDAALHSTAESSQAPFKHVQGNSTGPVPTGLVRRPALPGTQVLSTMSAPLRPPLHQRAATTESGRDGPLRPLTGNEPEVKSESTDLARSTKGPKRVPVSYLETSKPEGREEKRPLKSAFRELTSVNTNSAMSADGSATNPLPKATTLKRTKSKAALPSQPPATKTRAAALSKSETGTTTTREVRSEVKGTKDAPLRSTSRMDNAPSSQRGNEARAKETKKEAAKPVWGQRAASKSGPAKASGAKQSSMNKKENVGAGARPGSKKQTPEPEKIPLPSSPLASPTPSLVPLPPSPDVAEAILPPEDSTAPAEPREAAEELESMNDNAEASEELHDEAAPLALDPATATQPITTAKNQALRSRVAFLQDELPTPARTPISKLVSAIERGFIFTPGSPQAGLEPYDLSLDSSIDIMTPIPALAIPAKDAGDQSF
ncbi:hypothetical protein GLOTRDRAFT_137746 [Gloeophyllum trabeum ATCC 11539]|uniref:Uncharacterized protein n=1 Tax=Gloeophyllum trabeum (strain ATCC 11539 / FP-39264 / Madison 617) TaxID=670483 RepID=S7RS02_GLOTA|nr:uncharacterized protein GLOTRDRAFT_137746 [Gloeophyllum trabeum ATCC 11539]EPQ57415.1 hypothetical protein GLOTRDRAFT_137746 [Gloeophyllum trabeum ATCC 11539]